MKIAGKLGGVLRSLSICCELLVLPDVFVRNDAKLWGYAGMLDVILGGYGDKVTGNIRKRQ